ncbi:5-methyltetrahydrofolate--homocysteine methyltransferase, putative [Babesia caballi]|uniref:5-methyltetrahydrofolate--homocysteine methyltransferase, putative n=1 Tax=Babesia caballi TaxID=5871 RepID=A0AAV4M3C2_BABCB|nr:5-methyltetrahydrofolate--homocysteine methyltransferase, putative [Babesia caballi]
MRSNRRHMMVKLHLTGSHGVKPRIFGGCLGRRLDDIDLRADVRGQQSSHVRNDVANQSDGKLTSLLHGPAVEETVEHGAGEEVTRTGGVHNLNTSGRDKEVLALEEDERALGAHGHDDDLVLGLPALGPLQEHLAGLLVAREAVKLGELIGVTANDVGLVDDGLQVLTVAAHAETVGQEGNNTLAALAGGVNHLVRELDLVLVCEHEAVHAVVFEVIHDGGVQIVGLQSVGGTEQQVHGALGVGGNQRVQLAGEQSGHAHRDVFHTVVNERLAEIPGNVVVAANTEERDRTAEVGVGAGSVAGGATGVSGLDLHPLTQGLERLGGDAVGFTLGKVQTVNHRLVDAGVLVNHRVAGDQDTGGTLFNDLLTGGLLARSVRGESGEYAENSSKEGRAVHCVYVP